MKVHEILNEGLWDTISTSNKQKWKQIAKEKITAYAKAFYRLINRIGGKSDPNAPYQVDKNTVAKLQQNDSGKKILAMQAEILKIVDTDKEFFLGPQDVHESFLNMGIGDRARVLANGAGEAVNYGKVVLSTFWTLTPIYKDIVRAANKAGISAGNNGLGGPNPTRTLFGGNNNNNNPPANNNNPPANGNNNGGNPPTGNPPANNQFANKSDRELRLYMQSLSRKLNANPNPMTKGILRVTLRQVNDELRRRRAVNPPTP